MAAMCRAQAETANGVITQLNEVSLTAPPEFAPLIAEIASRLSSLVAGWKTAMNAGALKGMQPDLDLAPFERVMQKAVEAEQGTGMTPSLENLFVELESKIRNTANK